MKSIQNILAIFFLIAATSMTAQSQEVTVAADEKADAEFDRYKTYTLATTSIDGATTYDQAMDDKTHQMGEMKSTDLHGAIKEAIKYEMDVRGYEKAKTTETQTQTGTADLLINYQILEQATDLQGFESAIQTPFGTVKAPGEGVNYNLEEGTLIIQMVDTEEGAVVWRGFASGLLDKDAIMMTQEDYEKQDQDMADADTEFDPDVDVDVDRDREDVDIDVQDREDRDRGEMGEMKDKDSYSYGMSKQEKINKKAKQAVHHIFREFEYSVSDLAISRN